MNKIASALALTAVVAAPAMAEARQVTFKTKLDNYGGNGAYVVIYVTDASGQYAGTLWMAGGKSKYYRHLTDWRRLSGGNRSEIDGITGASVGSGQTLGITLDLADTLIDAGYEIHIDTAVEDMRENPSDVTVPLTSAGAGKPVKGRGYVKAFTYDM